MLTKGIRSIDAQKPPPLAHSERMQPTSSVFSQITTALYPAEFARCALLFPNQRPTRGLTAYDQFLALCFGQLTYRESLRNIVACL